MIEGEKVTYAGDTDPFNTVGSLGKVIAVSGSAAHVQWTSGPKQGQIDLVEDHELVPQRGDHPTPVAATGSFASTLDMPSEVSGLQVRATYDEVGEEGLLNTLAETGHLAMAGEYVEEAMSYIASRIKQTPALHEVLAQLETDEADSLVERMATVLLADRMREN